MVASFLPTHVDGILARALPPYAKLTSCKQSRFARKDMVKEYQVGKSKDPWPETRKMPPCVHLFVCLFRSNLSGNAFPGANILLAYFHYCNKGKRK